MQGDTLLLYNLHSNKPRRQEKGKLPALFHLQPRNTGAKYPEYFGQINLCQGLNKEEKMQNASGSVT